jgi:nuclear transcription factor Y alpha
MKPGPKIPIRTINNDDYIYVNPKQYLRILQRREKRRRLNLSRLGKGSENPSMRPKYIHESRHKHAMTRERGKGGRFVSKKEESVKSKSDST